MPLQTGYLDDDGHPRLKIRVSGTNPNAYLDIDALIDTGFTGFLMLPLAQALPLGLALYGTGDDTLANGETVTNFLAKGTVSIMPADPSQHESVEGIIVLSGMVAEHYSVWNLSEALTNFSSWARSSQ